MFSFVLFLALSVCTSGIVLKPEVNGNKTRVPPSPSPSEQEDDRERELTAECLECICQATSGCSQNVRCRNEGVIFCGPYFISKVYWNEAGKPGSSLTTNETLDYMECTNERFCADDTVRGYMRRYASDCNKDGFVKCEDFALIHKNGPSGCRRPELRESAYFTAFKKCFDQVINTNIRPRTYYPIVPRR